MSAEYYKNKIQKLLTNNDSLCGLLFNEEGELYPYERDVLLGAADFFIKHSKQFFSKFEIEDILLSGGMASYIYNPDTDVDVTVIANLPNKEINEDTLQNIFYKINQMFIIRGFNFKILNRKIDVGVLAPKYMRKGSGLYSLMDNKWLSFPVHREFSFSLDVFYTTYCKYSKDIHNFVYGLEKYQDAFLTINSCKVLEKYLREVQQKALATKDIHPEQEYCMDYQLYRCLKDFGVVTHFRNYIMDSYKYNISVLEQDYDK